MELTHSDKLRALELAVGCPTPPGFQNDQIEDRYNLFIRLLSQSLESSGKSPQSSEE